MREASPVLLAARVVVLFAAMFGFENCIAESYEASEKDYLQDFPVVLSSSRLTQPMSETPNAMTVIDRAMIKASGFRSVAELFRLVPGMYVDYVNGSTPIVAYHGATDQYSRRMQVLVDGRSIYLPPFSSVDWESLPLQVDDIERIEVIRGPAAASYGANSTQGVINIISRDAGSLHGANIRTTLGEGGISDTSAHLGGTLGNLDFRATLGYRADNGFATTVLNDSNATRLADFRLNYHPGRDSFDLQFGVNDGVRGAGISGRLTDPFRDIKVNSNFQHATWTRAGSQDDEFKLHYYHIYYGWHDVGGQSAPVDNTSADRHELELQQTTQWNKSNRLVWGGGMRLDLVDSQAALVVPRSNREWRVFAHDEWRMTDSLLMNAGGMFENDGMGHSNTSPRLSLNYHMTPRQTLRAGYSVAYRTPATYEEYANQPQPRGYLAQGGLKPEKALSREIGYLGEFDSIRTSLDARIYSDDISDVIFIDPAKIGAPPLSPDGKPYGFQNLLAIRYRGAEATAKYHWSERGSLVFNFSRQIASCSITGTLREPLFLSTLQTLASQCEQMVPWNSGSVLLSQYFRNGIQLSAGYYDQGQVQMLNTTQQTRMRRVDLRAAKEFGGMGSIKGGEVALVVQNVFQDNYTGYSAVPQTDNVILFNRRAYLTASFDL